MEDSRQVGNGNKLPAVTIYTDGSCLGNPGPGGYGAVLLTETDGREYREEISGGYRYTTNSRMEIMAVVRALESLEEPHQVQIFSDSRYVVDAISLGWASEWCLRDWMETSTKPRKNADLWRRVLRHCKKHQVTIEWIKAHAGNKENERCDWLANLAAAPDLPPDRGCQPGNATGTRLFGSSGSRSRRRA